MCFASSDCLPSESRVHPGHTVVCGGSRARPYTRTCVLGPLISRQQRQTRQTRCARERECSEYLSVFLSVGSCPLTLWAFLPLSNPGRCWQTQHCCVPRPAPGRLVHSASAEVSSSRPRGSRQPWCASGTRNPAARRRGRSRTPSPPPERVLEPATNPGRPLAPPPPPPPPQALARMFQPLVGWAQRRYQAGLAERLRDYGLRYDDLYDPQMDLVRRAARPSRGARLWGALLAADACCAGRAAAADGMRGPLVPTRPGGRFAGVDGVRASVSGGRRRRSDSAGGSWRAAVAAEPLCSWLARPPPPLALQPSQSQAAPPRAGRRAPPRPTRPQTRPAPRPQRTSPRRCGGSPRRSSSRATSALSAPWT